MPDFNLTHTIREIADTTSLSDPREIAEKLVSMIPKDHIKAVLMQTLPTYVATTFSRDRLHSEAPKASKPRSSKVAAVRDDWKRRLNTPLVVGGTWKRFSDCTAADLYVVAASLRANAEQSMSKALYYETIADILEPDAVVASLEFDPTVAAA